MGWVQSTSRAAGRSLPGYGNIAKKIIRNSIARPPGALAMFLEFSWTLETSFFEIKIFDLKILIFHLDQLAQQIGLDSEL